MHKPLAGLKAAGLAAMLLAPVAHAQQTPAVDTERSQELATLKAELAAQRELVDKLMRELQAQRAKIERIEDRRDDAMPALADTIALPPRLDDALLDQQRGTGGQNSGAPSNVAQNNPQPNNGQQPGQQNQQNQQNKTQAKVAQNGQPAPPTNPPPSTPKPINGPAPGQAAARGAAQAQAQNGTPTRTERDQRPPEVAPLFEAPGVLTPRGKYILEPSLQFGYSSSNRVALVGYTVIPALLIGLVDVREVKRNTFTGSIAARTGINNRMEVELRVPYVYRSDATVSREIFTGTAAERVFSTSGKSLGDVELATRYQLNNGGADKPYYIAGLRYKSTTGKDPFEVVTDCQTRCIGENVTGTGLPLSLPTGSGFHSLQGSLTWLFPSDPAVFFGNISYLHNFKRDNVTRLVRDGVREPLGQLEPGAIIGFNFGMGLALNEKASLSLGYDHSTVGRMKQDGRTVPGSVRTQLGTLLLGYSYRFNEKRSMSVAVGAGVTRDTPDVSLTVRMPFSF
ncbi:hypothetical protein LQ564_12230 [Massilia sp. G4R7]|uniref:Acetate kinase n=1 Tax=Massilia phyllostachyos TaxID=2898585 RepID=A0ABS8Q5Q0_9BURK|nr:hypothetical protein [Massilia phyllostachyos]MCD2517073.1 hypothetical protein [Massilia phyllostachyos]